MNVSLKKTKQKQPSSELEWAVTRTFILVHVDIRNDWLSDVQGHVHPHVARTCTRIFSQASVGTNRAEVLDVWLVFISMLILWLCMTLIQQHCNNKDHIMREKWRFRRQHCFGTLSKTVLIHTQCRPTSTQEKIGLNHCWTQHLRVHAMYFQFF